MEHHHGMGAIPDPRPTELKARDYLHHEFLDMAAPVAWQMNEESTWPVYSVRDQDGSGSCVGQGTAKALEVLLGKVMSGRTTYTRRSTTGEGMYLQDAGNILSTIGGTTEALCPSQKLSEAQINLPITNDVGSVIASYFFIPVENGIDAVAAAIDQYKHVVWTFNISYTEWEQNVPEVNPETVSYDGGHCNCGTYRTLWNGQKAIVDDDSWGITGGTMGTTGRRIITEAFFNARCTGVMVLVPWVAPSGIKPVHTFSMSLIPSQTPNPEVIALQNCLKWEGCMSSAVPSTGIYGPLTTAAVTAFQEKYTAEILVPEGLNVGTGSVHAGTIAQLNKLYSR